MFSPSYCWLADSGLQMPFSRSNLNFSALLRSTPCSSEAFLPPSNIFLTDFHPRSTLEESLREDRLSALRRPLPAATAARPATPTGHTHSNRPPAIHIQRDSQSVHVDDAASDTSHRAPRSEATSRAAETVHNSDFGEDETEHRQFVCACLVELARHRMEVFAASHRKRLFGASVFHSRGGWILSMPCLGLPLIYLNRIERLYGDDAGFRTVAWQEFIEGMVMEWNSLNLISSLLLSCVGNQTSSEVMYTLTRSDRSAMTMCGSQEVPFFQPTRTGGTKRPSACRVPAQYADLGP